MLDSGRTPYLDRLFGRMQELGARVCYAGRRSDDLPARLEERGIRTVEFSMRFKMDIGAWRRFGRLIDDFKPDVIHTVTGRDAFVAIRAGRKRGVRIYVRRGAYATVSRFDPTDRVIFGRNGASRFLTVSRDLERHLVERGVKAERVRTIYTAVYSETFLPEEADLRAEHGVPPDRFLIGLVANYRPVKGIQLLWDSLVRLRQEDANFHLLVAGDGYEKQRAVVEQLGIASHITFLGHVGNIRRFTPNVDCVVFPSKIDALPRGAIEATVLGTPVVATRVGGIPEILDGGRGGWLTEPADPGAFAAGLAEAMHSPEERAKRVAAVLERNRELFSVDRCARTHMELYQEDAK